MKRRIWRIRAAGEATRIICRAVSIPTSSVPSVKWLGPKTAIFHGIDAAVRTRVLFEHELEELEREFGFSLAARFLDHGRTAIDAKADWVQRVLTLTQ